MGVLRFLGLRQAGGTHYHISKRIKQLGIDTSHFRGSGWNKGKTFENLWRKPEDILIVLPEGSQRIKRKFLVRAMLSEGLQYKCRCGNVGEWEGNTLTLEVNHKDGNWLNNKIENLEFLCPNCHSQESHSNMPHKARVAQLAGGNSFRASTVQVRILSRVPSVCQTEGCGIEISYGAKNCRTHEYALRSSRGLDSSNTKIQWPSDEDLLEKLSYISYSGLARELGVSDNAIRKHLRKRGINPPKRHKNKHGSVVELVDALDSNSSVH